MALPLGLKHRYLVPIAVGAAAGTLGSATVLMAYALLFSKGIAVSLATKTALGAKTAGIAGNLGTASSGHGLVDPQDLINLLVSGSAGGVGGGVTGTRIAKSLVNQGIAPLQQRLDALAGQVSSITDEPLFTPYDTTPGNDLGSAGTSGTAPTPTGSNSELQRIRGIGPKFSKMLSQGGITTLSQLAAAEAQAVCNLVTSSESGAAKSQTENWIQQARAIVDDETGDHQ